jgi:serine protease
MKKIAFGSAFVLTGLVASFAYADQSRAADITDGLSLASANGVDLATAPERSDEEIPGELVIDVKDNLSDGEIADLGREYGISIRDNSPDIKDDGNIEISDVPLADEAGLIERLSHDPRVESVEPNFMFHATWVPNDPKYKEQWHLTRVGAESAWNYSCGQGVTVAVVDTGIACYDGGGFTKGTDLNGTRCVEGYNYVGKNKLAADDQGHGTHVAGTIAQTTNNGHGVAGLAYCAQLMPVKVLSSRGSGTMADVGEGIRFAADHGAQVINLSLGASRGAKVVKDAVDHALAKGVVVVAAAGNSGGSVGYPAAYPGVIAVSATDSKDKLAWFSSRGKEVVIGAPGVNVTQQTICQGGKNKCEIFGAFNGTSMASPHVAGVAAMLVSEGLTDSDAVRSALVDNADKKDDPKQFGAGILNADRATSHVWWAHLMARVAALFAFGALVFGRIKKKGGVASKGPLMGIFALLGSVGLAPFLPVVGMAQMGAARPYLEALARPLGEWDLVLLGVDFHKYLLLASALPALGLAVLLFGVKRLRPAVGGLALGTGALLTQLAASGDVAFVFGSFGLRIFAFANIALLGWLATVSLNKKD